MTIENYRALFRYPFVENAEEEV